MTTQLAARNAFVLTATEGRTPQPLNVLGTEALVKLASADIDGAVEVFNHTVAPMYGPPLHRHSREDEWFYILKGEITFQVDGKRATVHAGGSAFAPRGTTHTFKNFTTEEAEILAVITPGGFLAFFEELTLLGDQVTVSDPAAIERVAEKYGIEILGPPLS
jgi:quercetin dioxygenase-like cupin family protein